MIKRIFTSILVVFFCAGLAIADGQDRINSKDQDKQQQKAKSCQTVKADSMSYQILAEQSRQMKGNQNGEPKTLRDGSCQTVKADSMSYQILAKQSRNMKGNQKGNPKTLRDGSCQTSQADSMSYQILAKQSRNMKSNQKGNPQPTRSRDGSCQV